MSAEKRAQIIGCLTEGMSIRATVRITGAAKNTITKLLVDLGEVCADYQDRTLVDLPCKTIECDEIWLEHYNQRRPHSGIDNRPPISRVHNLRGQDS